MANLNGRWKVTNTENAEAFITATGLSGEKVDKLRALASNPDTILEIQTDGSVFNRKTWISGEMKQEQDGVIGEEYERDSNFGRIKVKIDKESDSRVKVHQTGGLGTSDMVLTVDGNQLSYSWTLNGATLVRQYTKA